MIKTDESHRTMPENRDAPVKGCGDMDVSVPIVSDVSAASSHDPALEELLELLSADAPIWVDHDGQIHLGDCPETDEPIIVPDRIIF